MVGYSKSPDPDKPEIPNFKEQIPNLKLQINNDLNNSQFPALLFFIFRKLGIGFYLLFGFL